MTMRRLELRPVACAALAVVVMAYVGCSGDPAVNTDDARQNRPAQRRLERQRRPIRRPHRSIS